MRLINPGYGVSNVAAMVSSGITWDALVDPNMPAFLSVSSARHATMFDSSGALTFGPNNWLTQSNSFNTYGAWYNYDAVASGAADPDGGNNAWTYTAPGDWQSLIQYVGVGFPQGSQIGAVYLRRRSGTGVVQLIANGNGSGALSLTSSWELFYYKRTGHASDCNFGIQCAVTGDQVDVYKASLSCVGAETTPRSIDMVTTTSAAYFGPRFDYDPGTLGARGLMLETSVATNLFLDSGSPATQSITITNGQPYTVSFYGTGSIALSNAVSHTMNGTSSTDRTRYTFTAGSTTLTLPLSGSVLHPQVEAGSGATSYILTQSAATVTRLAETATALIYTGDSATLYYRLLSDDSQSSKTINPFSDISSENGKWGEKITLP